MKIRYLRLKEVLDLHSELIRKFGGLPGILNQGLLESALAQPKISSKYSDQDLPGLAASYLYHIANAHAFVDGNKRTALASLIIFLRLNGYKINLSTDELENLTLKVVSDKINKNEIAEIIKIHSIKSQH